MGFFSKDPGDSKDPKDPTLRVVAVFLIQRPGKVR